MSILANLGYLIFKIFWGSMPPDDLGPMVKIESTFMRDETPELYKILIALLQILKTWLLWHFFQSYMLFLVIIERKIENSFRDQSRQNSLLVCLLVYFSFLYFTVCREIIPI